MKQSFGSSLLLAITSNLINNRGTGDLRHRDVHVTSAKCRGGTRLFHYDDVIMGALASQITSLTSVYTTVYSDADQRKHQSSASLAFLRGIHRGPVNSPHKWPVTRKMFPFHDVIMHGLSIHMNNPLISPIRVWTDWIGKIPATGLLYIVDLLFL